MDAKLKADWLKALRSGEYRQAQASLRHRGAFCCLGVLADIQGAKWVNGSPIFDGVENDSAADLEPRFAGGLRRATQQTLADMNDKGESFKKIADYIERRIA